MIEKSPVVDLQMMLFRTTAGQALLELFMATGHFYEEIENDQARIEHNTVKRILTAAGVQMELKPRPVTEPVKNTETNLMDDILSEGNEDA